MKPEGLPGLARAPLHAMLRRRDVRQDQKIHEGEETSCHFASTMPAPEPRGPAHRLRSFSASDRLIGRAAGLVSRHPYVSGSIALHVLAALALTCVPGMGASEQARSVAAEAARSQVQMASTEARGLDRQVARIAEIQQEMSDAAGEPSVPAAAARAGASPSELLARALAMSASIEAAHRKLRADKLAQMTGMTPEEARRRIDTEAAGEGRPRKGDAAQAIAQLERRAREIRQARRAQLDREREGVPVSVVAAASGIPRAGGVQRNRSDQLVALARIGAPQGRVGTAGVEGGTSVDPRAGTQAGAARRALAIRHVDERPPVMSPGGSRDLTDARPDPRPDRDASVAFRNPGGRVFGADGIFATRAYLDSWYVIGPFAGHGGHSMETAYPPEADVDLDGVYAGLDGRVLTWRYASRGFYPFVPPDRAENAVYYAYTEVRIDDDRDVWLDIAADDDSMLWLDGRLVWVSEPGDKPWYHGTYYLPDERSASMALAEGRRRVHFGRGVHRLLFKLYNDQNPTFFSVVVAS